MSGKKKIKHNYTSELELKSLLIRIKNEREFEDEKSYRDNSRINKYILWHTKLSNIKYQSATKKNKVKNHLKEEIVRLSESTCIDTASYERFGEIILLMIKMILTKPQFSGYTFKDEFYSDAIYKILLYLGNFNHNLISVRTGIKVNAFAYISTIIHHSVLYIIIEKKKEFERQRKRVEMEHINHNWELKSYELFMPETDENPPKIVEEINLKSIKTTLYDELVRLEQDIERSNLVKIFYPRDYVITFDEYNKIKPLLKGKVSISRKPNAK